MCISICKIEELDGDFGCVSGDLTGCHKEMEESCIARFECGVIGNGGVVGRCAS